MQHHTPDHLELVGTIWVNHGEHEFKHLAQKTLQYKFQIGVQSDVLFNPLFAQQIRLQSSSGGDFVGKAEDWWNSLKIDAPFQMIGGGIPKILWKCPTAPIQMSFSFLNGVGLPMIYKVLCFENFQTRAEKKREVGPVEELAFTFYRGTTLKNNL